LDRRRKGIAIVKLRPFYAVLERELVRMIRQRTRLVAAMVRPLIWLLVIGGGFNSLIGRAHGVDYQDFLVPGVLGMTTLFGAMLAALTTVYDKESGVMRMMIVAPLPHAWIVLAKMFSAALAAIVQALLLIVILLVLGHFRSGTDWLLLGASIVAASFACAGIGMLTASFSRTLDNFAAAMNFVIFPVFFLSGSLYPVQSLPLVLKRAAMINPYTYGVDFLKHAILPASVPTDFSVALDIAVLAGFSVAALAVASWRFSQESAYEPMIHVLAGKRS
jgi:ABC-2 type transport system permease protein